MTSYTAADDDLERFLSLVGRHLGRLGATATIDLYTDGTIKDPRAHTRFEEISRHALSEAAHARSGGDALMAVPLDLTTDEGLESFALLGFRTIGCEVVLGKKLVFTTIENENTVWLDLPPEDTSALESQAHAAGAGVTRV